MTVRTNAQGQPIGDPLPDWTGAQAPAKITMQGRFCTLVPLDTGHGPDLFTAYSADTTGTLWTYLSVGPFTDFNAFADWMDFAVNSRDPLFFAIIDERTGKPVGVASYLRIQPEIGVIEVGYIAFSPLLQRQPAATEAMFLMMRHAFDVLGYRRYEWKCDALNAPSRRAAERLGFVFEGIFRQAMVYKGRNRDTAWFSILDRDWPRIGAALSDWLDPENFDESGNQRKSLSAFMQR